MFQYKGPEADEIVGGRVAPKKAERKKIARVGQITRDQAPAASKDGMSISERRLFESMQQGKKTKKKKREREDEDGKQQQKQQGEKRREDSAAVKRLKQVEAAASAMEPAAYRRALGQALRAGLQEQRAEAVVVARQTGKQTEKNRAYRQAKKQKKQRKSAARQTDQEEERKFVGTKETIRFGEVVQAPPAMDKWVAKLESMKQKIQAKKSATAMK